jgi:hypothetical protein
MQGNSAQSGLAPSHEKHFTCDLGREKCKRGDNCYVITAMNLLQGPRTRLS